MRGKNTEFFLLEIFIYFYFVLIVAVAGSSGRQVLLLLQTNVTEINKAESHLALVFQSA